MRAPGTVVRCRHCGNVVMVLVPLRGELRADSSAFRMDQAPGES
jgi:desulfoferrodoxin-like iron-binding protein